MNDNSPGPLCRFLGALAIDAGTLCRNASPIPGTVGLHGRRVRHKTDASSRIYREHRGVVNKPLDYRDKPVYLEHGKHECAALVKKLAGAPNTGTDNWQKGVSLNPRNVTSLEVGTPIATGWNS